MRTRVLSAVWLHQAIYVLIAVMFLTAGCATFWGGASNTDKAIAAARAQKLLVEASMTEVLKLGIVGRLSPAEIAEAERVYLDWYAGQEALARTMAAWRTVASKENDEKLSTALDEVARLASTFLSFAGRFVDLDALQKRIGASLTLSGDDESIPPFTVASLEPIDIATLRFPYRDWRAVVRHLYGGSVHGERFSRLSRIDGGFAMENTR